MPLPQRFPFVPRLVVALMSVVLVLVVGTTLATAQSSEPVSTGPLTAPAVADGATAGDTIRLRGAGFAPGSSVDVTIESDPVLLTTVTADAAGAFAATVRIPSGLAPGAHTLKATGPDPAGGLRVLSVPVTVSARPVARSLATTGTDVALLSTVGAAAILAGGGVLAVRRRRS